MVILMRSWKMSVGYHESEISIVNCRLKSPHYSKVLPPGIPIQSHSKTMRTIPPGSSKGGKRLTIFKYSHKFIH